MGCGCGGAKAHRPVRNLVQSSPSEGILRAVTTNRGTTNVPANASPTVESQILTDEKRKIEKLRRDAILRALGRPS